MNQARFRSSSWLSVAFSVLALLGVAGGPAYAVPCVVPDNGTGTITMPPLGCDYSSTTEVFEIIDGLPAATTLEFDGPLGQFFCDGPGVCSLGLSPGTCEAPGGSLGGHGHCFSASLDFVVTGTGDLAGFNRIMTIPVQAEVHTGPRNPGDPVQPFANDMFRLHGDIYGDPDFDTLIFTFGTDFGLPSPGSTTLTELPSGDFAVDSFFDITYQIEFVGAPGSVLEGLGGTTTGSIRIATEVPATDCVPLADASGCEPVMCPEPTDTCNPTCVNFDPATGTAFITECDCRESSEWGLTFDDGLPTNGCVVADNGTGTITHPPAGCEYLSPEEVYQIIDGLFPGDTIELDGPFKDFFCPDTSGFCSLPIPPGNCEQSGGALGGDAHCFEATLELAATGTGSLAGFNRTLFVPMIAEGHTGPRTPGDPVQAFPADMLQIQGEIFGDPDFCTFRFRAGSTFGLPSPGSTTLRRLGDGSYAVDSFFDITYQIEFEGCPGSQLDGLSGTTTATIRVETGVTPPACSGDCPPNTVCTEDQVMLPDGTVDICCVMTPVVPLIFEDGFETGDTSAWNVTFP